jgi:hypothetical protein
VFIGASGIDLTDTQGGSVTSNTAFTYPVAYTQLLVITGIGCDWAKEFVRMTSATNTGANVRNFGTDGKDYSRTINWIAFGI